MLQAKTWSEEHDVLIWHNLMGVRARMVLGPIVFGIKITYMQQVFMLKVMSP